jgi:predicted lipoprotein with Yx(FWY)xxD motif
MLNLPKGTSKSDFGTITRKNGAMQTTYNGKPLYYFIMDKNANEAKGDGKKGVWHIIK